MKPFRILIAALSISLSTCTFGQLTYQLDSTMLAIDLVVDESRVDIPWEVLWGPDQRLWMTDGPMITRWDPVLDEIDTLAVRPYGNGLGMALHPFFPQVPEVFAVFDTSEYYAGGQLCEVVRFEYDLLLDTLINDTVLLSYPHLGEHGGGRLLFDNDQKLLCTTADYWPEADTLGHKMGKVLRMNTDGTVPADNPTSDHTFTRGHRNPQGLTMLPNGNIIVSEHGMPNDEINHLQAGLNYGWPVWDGNFCTNIYPDSCLSSTYIVEPPMDEFFYPPSGIEHYPHNEIPEFTDKTIACALWVQGFVVHSYNATYDEITNEERYEGGAFWDLGRIRDIAVLPDGSFYLITNDRQDARIRHVKKALNTGVVDASASAFSVRPNPVKETLFISFETSTDLSLELFDVNGRKLNVKFERQDEGARLDVSGLEAGLYILHYRDGSSTFSERIVVE